MKCKTWALRHEPNREKPWRCEIYAKQVPKSAWNATAGGKSLIGVMPCHSKFRPKDQACKSGPSVVGAAEAANKAVVAQAANRTVVAQAANKTVGPKPGQKSCIDCERAWVGKVLPLNLKSYGVSIFKATDRPKKAACYRECEKHNSNFPGKLKFQGKVRPDVDQACVSSSTCLSTSRYCVV